MLRREAGSAAENLGEIPLVVEPGHGGDLMDALRGIFGEQALGVIDAHVGEQIDVRHAERLFQHGAEIGSRDADGVRSGGLRVLKVVVGAGIEHGVDDDGVPCLHFVGGMGKAAFERLPDGIVIGGTPQKDPLSGCVGSFQIHPCCLLFYSAERLAPHSAQNTLLPFGIPHDGHFQPFSGAGLENT